MRLLRSDGCTFFPEGSYTSCCTRHDMAYLFGHSKWKADKQLRECVIKSGHPIYAWIMWIGVTLGGWYNWYKAKSIVSKARSR